VTQPGTMVRSVHSQRALSRAVVKAAVSADHHSASSAITTWSRPDRLPWALIP